MAVCPDGRKNKNINFPHRGDTRLGGKLVCTPPKDWYFVKPRPPVDVPTGGRNRVLFRACEEKNAAG